MSKDGKGSMTLDHMIAALTRYRDSNPGLGQRCVLVSAKVSPRKRLYMHVIGTSTGEGCPARIIAEVLPRGRDS